MHYAIKDRETGTEIVTDNDEEFLEEILIEFEMDDISNDCYKEDIYYIEIVYDDDDIKSINEQITEQFNQLIATDTRICDINTYSSFTDFELFSRILTVDKKHLVVIYSLSIAINESCEIESLEIINKNYCI